MIKTRQDLKEYLQADLDFYLSQKNSHAPGLKDWLLHNEFWYTWKYIKTLRNLEYYLNNKERSLFHKIAWLYYVRRHKVLSWRYSLRVYPNCVDKGLRIFHCGPVMLSKNASIGKNFTCRTGTVIATNVNGKEIYPEIGDNVQCSLGVKILCRKIGRGAALQANTVVVNNVPPYAIVAGNPAKIIGFLYSPEEIVEFEKEHYPESERIPLDVLQDNYRKYFLDRIKEIKNFLGK